jgi:hypothetical protein
MGNAKVFLLIAGLTALFGMVGGAIAGQGGALVALVIAGIMNFIAYFNSSTMVLKAYGAHTLRRDEAPKLYDTVDRLRRNAGLPMPTLAVAPQPQPNAFATGRNAEHAVVCVTQGLLQVLNQDELEGVLAHELGPIRPLKSASDACRSLRVLRKKAASDAKTFVVSWASKLQLLIAMPAMSSELAAAPNPPRPLLSA